MAVHPVLTEVFRAWEEGGCVWALLRVPSSLDAPDGDVDVLLHSAWTATAIELAQTVGFVTLPRRSSDTHLLMFHRDTDRWLWLHCTSELGFGPHRAVRPGGEIECLAARQTVESVSRLATGDQFWISLLHAALDQRRISEVARQRLRTTCASAAPAGRLAECLSPLLPADWSPVEVLECVRREDWTALERILPTVWARALERARVPWHARVVRFATRVARHALGLRRNRGMSVALIGPDGAGKTTLAAGLQASFIFPSKKIYMGLTGGWLHRVDRLRIPGVVRVARLCVIWGRYLRGVYHTRRGRLVIFERYILDAAVPPPYPLSPSGRLARWVDGHSCPAPDLVLILDASGQLMHQRKQEYSPEVLEDWRQRFLMLRGKLRHVAVIDTSQPAEVVRTEAVERIWQRYAERLRQG
jgi:thymidylate kinase